ncbi:cation diffusion facilitator family transporter [Puniceibacterium sp. IMCC21224]|uniref:cation diffusion facilitator family transporter n=1 Tax=Puniceibacterium sp. IMCC21224 TaxID=1618204 RepID=UPI00064DAB14|nr:cation diffusion facilitator family transporter [Puniceibacterium sp. IMCC21224]KMK68398.1 cation diffusion facilitator family transporter [Puniceibacterium sp. IMCC21224]
MSDDHDHCHDHDHGDGTHSHAPDVSASNERVVLVGFVLTFGFMLAELVGGLLSGSLALIADAGHMFTDAAALALAWAGFRFGRRKSDDKRTFGYMRFEILAGFVNAVTLILLVIWIAYEAVQRLLEPAPVMAGPMLVIAVLGLVVNGGVFWMLMKGDRDHVNIRGAMVHVMGDMLGSVAAIVAAVAIYFTGWTPIDPILSVLLSAIVLRSAWALLKASLNVLMEGTPGNVVVSDLKDNLIAKVPGLVNVDHVHVWSITSGQPSATMDVQLRADAEPAAVVGAIKALLAADYGIAHSTIEIDWGQGALVCTLDPGEQPGGGRTHDHTHDHDHDHASLKPA